MYHHRRDGPIVGGFLSRSTGTPRRLLTESADVTRTLFSDNCVPSPYHLSTLHLLCNGGMWKRRRILMHDINNSQGSLNKRLMLCGCDCFWDQRPEVFYFQFVLHVSKTEWRLFCVHTRKTRYDVQLSSNISKIWRLYKYMDGGFFKWMPGHNLCK